MYARRKWAKLNYLGSAKKQWSTEITWGQFSRGNTVPSTQRSHHFIPLPSSKIAHKLLSEDKSHAGTHDFNLPTTFQLCDIRPMTYVTCLYDSFWLVGLVTQVDVEQGDAKVQFMLPHRPSKTFNSPETEDSCYVPIKNIICHIFSYHNNWGNL